MTLSPDKSLLLVSSKDGTVFIYNPRNGKRIRQIDTKGLTTGTFYVKEEGKILVIGN